MPKEISPRTKGGLPLMHWVGGTMVPEKPDHIMSVVKLFDNLIAYAPYTEEVAKSASVRMITSYFKRLEWVEREERKKAKPGLLTKLRDIITPHKT